MKVCSEEDAYYRCRGQTLRGTMRRGLSGAASLYQRHGFKAWQRRRNLDAERKPRRPPAAKTA